MVRDSDRALADLLAEDPAARAEWEATQKLREDPRVISGIGSFLRATSLDQLPQLVNVIRGDMSLVGPRPVTETELANYGIHVSAYLSLRPGLTGPWQVSGRSDTTYEERVRLDASYAAKNSLLRESAVSGRRRCCRRDETGSLPAVLLRRGQRHRRERNDRLSVHIHRESRLPVDVPAHLGRTEVRNALRVRLKSPCSVRSDGS